jgi:hypothetical protein
LLKIKNLLLIGIFSVLLLGCSKANTSETPITSNSYIPINQSSYPSPIEQPTVPPVNTAYPSPIDLGGAPTAASTQVYFVTGLVVPTPNSGKAVVTGKLLGSGNGTEPFITSIYLATVEPATTAGATPEVKYSEQTDPIATQDLTTGQFMLTNVTPGQYALVIWTQNGGIPLKDGSGNPIIFNVNYGEIKDLGDIHVP